jgi:hypothetical protein
MAMTPDNGLLILGSSVYRKRGYMYRKFKELHGNDASDDLCWFAPSVVMNRMLSPDVVDRAITEDAPKANAEFRNIWREDLADFIPPDAIENATDFGTYERPPQPEIKYLAFADSAGGTGGDSFALCIGHHDPARDTLVIDLVRERKPRFVPSAVIAEWATLLRSYGIAEVWSDDYAKGFHRDL